MAVENEGVTVVEVADVVANDDAVANDVSKLPLVKKPSRMEK